MKQFRITSKTIRGPSGGDCYISPDDPMYHMVYEDDPETMTPEKRQKLHNKGVRVVDGAPRGFSMDFGKTIGLNK